MFSNLTIYALTASLLSQSPMLTSINKYSSNNVLRIQNAMTRNFATHFLYAKTQTLNALITKSSFSHYLHTPLHFQDSDYSKCQNTQPSVVNQTFDKCQLSYDETSSNVVVIMDSTFTKCSNSHDSESSGGAILFVKDGELTVHDTFFQTCSINGNSVGGAICACKALGTIGYYMGHDCAKLFHSHYCCYSDCSGQYGGAAFVVSQNLELNYSSVVGNNSPTFTQPHGAQFDLNATGSLIGSEFVNVTGGLAKYCAAIEYRQAQNGFFRFQTLLNNTGSYISTFTKLDDQVDISYSNYINSHLQYDYDAAATSLIFVRQRSVTLSYISIQGLSFSGDPNNNYRLIKYDPGNEKSTPTLKLINCSWASNYNTQYPDLLKDAETSNIRLVDTDDNVPLNPIQHLDLQDCKGAVVPPTREDLIEIIESIEASPTDTINYTTPSSTEEIEGGGNNNENDSQQNDKDKGGFPVGAIAGIAVGAAAVVAGVVAFFVIRHHRLSLNPEGVNEVGEAETNIVSNDNPLYNHQQEDDPFQEDFNADAL